MNIEQLRAEFEAWALNERIAYRDENHGVCFYNGEKTSYWIGYQAGRAALQSQDREDAERYRWLRNHPLDGLEETTPCIRAADDDADHWALSGADADAAIDHARRVEEK